MSTERNNPAARAVHLRIGGQVQGVGFRYYVMRVAQDRGVRGFVRNLASGDVEVLAEGEPESLESFVKEVRQGPRFSRVERMDRRETEVSGSFDGFEIRY